MAHIIISYSRKDIDTTDHIVSRLKQLGFEIWIDRKDIKGGNLWRVEIVEAIDSADAFVLMLSPNSAASDNVRKEVDLAESSGRRLFPVLLAAVTLPPQLRYQLAGIQWLDYAASPEEKLNELAEVLRAHQLKLSAIEMEDKTRQAEVVIGGINLSSFGVKEQEKLLNFIAEITATPRGDLSFTNLSAGSVHATIRMPAHSAYVLKTAALNRDKRLLKYGIGAVRLDAEPNYVLVRRGEFGSLKTMRRSSWLARFLAGIIILAIVIAAGLFIPPIVLPLLRPTSTPTLTVAPTSSATSTLTATLTPTITSTPVPQVLFDFISEAESAFWNSCESRSCELSASGIPLKFGFPDSQKSGFATYASEYLEDGEAYKEFLYTHPIEVSEGGVRGFYDVSSVTIQSGDRFEAKVGFLLDAKSVDGVTYRIYFLRGDTPPEDPIRKVYEPVVLGEYARTYSGQLDEWTFILPENIVGQNGWFILQVDARKSPIDDLAVWIEARLVRP